MSRQPARKFPAADRNTRFTILALHSASRFPVGNFFTPVSSDWNHRHRLRRAYDGPFSVDCIENVYRSPIYNYTLPKTYERPNRGQFNHECPVCEIYNNTFLRHLAKCSSSRLEKIQCEFVPVFLQHNSFGNIALYNYSYVVYNFDYVRIQCEKCNYLFYLFHD